ncbi:MAG: hypothetical protein KF767_12675 [Bdellovibrionaceae bacterium]|nr:hypothetical protein [Pseudobdellovibrionaceae bacterium]
MKTQVGEKAMKARTTGQKLLIVAGLVVASYMSTSYARSNSPGGGQCASSYKDLESHPEAGGRCSPSALRSQVSRLRNKTWYGPFGYKVEFRDPGSGPFFVIVNGAKKYGNLCCSGGVWSLPGYGAITPRGNNGLSIGSHSFSSQQDSHNRHAPLQFAELPNATNGVN